MCRQECAASCLWSSCPHRTRADRCTPPFFRAFYALTVDDGKGRAGFPLGLFSTQLIEHVMHPLQRAVISPKIEIAMDRAFRRKIFRDRAPLTARRENVHEAVHHLAHDHRALATASLAPRDQRLDQSPFVIGQIARISQLAAVVTGAVLARPHRWPFLESGHHSWITDDSYDSRTLRTDTKIFDGPAIGIWPSTSPTCRCKSTCYRHFETIEWEWGRVLWSKAG